MENKDRDLWFLMQSINIAGELLEEYKKDDMDLKKYNVSPEEFLFITMLYHKTIEFNDDVKNLINKYEK